MCTRYDHGGGASAPVTALSSERGGGGGRQDRRCTLAMIQDEGLGQTGAPAYVVVRGVASALACAWGHACRTRGVRGCCWLTTSHLAACLLRIHNPSAAPSAGGGVHQLCEAGEHVLPGLHAAAQRAHLQQEGHGTGRRPVVRPNCGIAALQHAMQ